MKRMKKMALLVGMLVVLLCGYALMNRSEETAAVEEETGSFELTAKTADELIGLEWTKDGEAFSFTLADGVWQKTDQAAYPVAQNVVQTLADQLMELKGSRKLENVTDLSIYGLSEPAFTVTVHWSDGSATDYQMGDATPFSDGYYLALSDQTEAIYTLSSSLSSVFNKSMDDFADMEAVPAVAEVTRLTVGDTFDAAWQDESSTINASQHWYAADGRALDGVEELVADAEAITWDHLAEAVASEEQLAQWKLDEENATVLTLYDGDESVSILFGAADENGDYYARLPESTMVYTVAAADVDDLLNASPENKLSLALAETEYADLQEAVFTVGDVAYTVIPPAETEGEEAEEAEADPAEALWEQFTALKATAHAEKPEKGETLLEVHVTVKTGIEATFTFIEYDADSYLVAEGERAMLTAADKVDKLIRTLKNME